MMYSNLITMEVVEHMDKPVKCAWCGEMTVPKVGHPKNDYGDIIERRCSKCGKVLAAYLEQKEDFLPDIRTF